MSRARGHFEPVGRPALFEGLEERQLLTTFTVTSNGDVPILTGTTLREAIVMANLSPGADVIRFNIAGTPTIHPLTALPPVTGETTIDGTTQAGYAPGRPVVFIDGTATLPDLLTGNADGLRFTGGDSTFRGVIVGGFGGGAGVRLSGPGGYVLAGNWIGTDESGADDRGNLEGVVVERVEVGGGVIQEAPSTRIGGTTLADRNVISGNFLDGVRFDGVGDGSVVSGNYIGVTAAGDAALPNFLSGIQVESGSASTDLVIGGTAAGAGNVLSGNSANGVTITDTSGVHVLGNFIGTDAAGTAAVPNEGNGVVVELDSGGVVIGGASAAARNVISGNDGDGVRLEASGSGTVVQGNYIGADVTGAAPLGNGGNGVSVLMAGARIGGGTAAAGNVIAANDGFGVELLGSGSRLEFNRIGTAADGTSALGNLADGVSIDGSDNRIGTPGTGNTIAHNGGTGVTVTQPPANVRNAIRGNNIFLNGELGIDLGNDGVTMNDSLDADEGPNEFQNFPELTSITLSGGTATIHGTLHGTPGSTFAVDLFVSEIWDTSTYGEGQKYLGSTTLTTDAAGNGSFTATLPGVPAGWNYFAATATDAAGNTSEFSYDPTPGAAPEAAAASKSEGRHARGAFGNRKLASIFDGDEVATVIGKLAATLEKWFAR